MKKNFGLISVLFLFGFLVLSLTGCKQKEDPSFDNKTPAQPLVKDESGTASIADISSINLVKNMKAGWNLGNTLDAFIAGSSGLSSETCWGNPKTTKEIIHMGTENGYKTIRIPVTWFNHIIDKNYTIDSDWMKRVKTIVDWAIADGYYVILNEHHSVHDNMNDPLKYGDGYIIRNNPTDIAESKAFLKAVWTQIAAAFNSSYDEHLIFETMNEPRNTGHEHCWIPGMWGAANCAECKADYGLLNEYNQICLDAIRASGGANANRFVLIPSLCTSDNTTTHSLFKLPNDTAKDKLILTVHNYVMGVDKNTLPETFTSKHKSDLDNMLTNLETNYISKGIPVVFGETGAMRYIDAGERTKWITYFAGKASSLGISLVYWDDGGDFRVFDRSNLKIVNGDEAFVKAFSDAYN